METVRSCRFAARTAMAIAVLALVVVPGAGCGGTKKAPLTIAQRLERARGQKTPELQSRELVRVARMQLRAGDRKGAAKTLSEARGLIPKDADAMLVAPRTLEVAALFAEMGEKTTARGVLDEVISLAGGVADPLGKTILLAEAGGILGTGPAGVGDAAKARATLTDAAGNAETVDARFRSQALAAVALGYAEAGLLDEAKAMVETLVTSARAVEEPRRRAEALAAAANVRGRGGDTAAAQSLLTEAAEAAETVLGAENKAYALLAVARATAAAGNADGAAKLLAKADEAARKVPDPEAQRTAREKVLAAKK
jgi:hypothetical protein